MKRPPADLGRVESIYVGTKRLGSVMRARDGWLSRDIDGKLIGTFPEHALATRAVFDAGNPGPPRT